MRTKTILIFFLSSFTSAFGQSAGKTNNPFIGKWVRMTQAGQVALEFLSDGSVNVDFGNDGSTDVNTGYSNKGNTMIFSDRKGEMCPEAGSYMVDVNDFYMSFDLIDDLCNGRIRMTVGFWTRPDFDKTLDAISAQLEETGNAELYLTRARIYLATGNVVKAQNDLDEFIRNDSINARAFINRAGTRFPNDLKGVISDCDNAILLEPQNKNAWFLRGLANYELGNRGEACDDFLRAIELGFSVLKIAEEQRCREYWDERK